MSNSEIIAPVNHSAGSALGTTAAGAAGGAIKGGVKTWLGWMGASIVGGALLGLMFATGGAGVIAWGTVAWVVGGAVGGGLLGGLVATPVAGIGAAVGGFTGASRASDRVREERGAAAVVDAQIEMARAQNAGVSQTTVYAPTATANNKYAGVPAAGERGNRAPSVIHGANDNSVHADVASRTQASQGTLVGQQVAAGR